MNATMNETTSRNKSLADFLDPDADVAFGFWLNGVGILIIGLMGICGNLASIRVLSTKQMRSSVNFILIALACSDVAVIITSILMFGFTTFYPYNGYFKSYFFIANPKIVYFAFPVGIIAQAISIYLTFLISLERYVAVCHPLKARSYCTQARTKMSILVVVVVSIVYNIPKFFEIDVAEFDGAAYNYPDYQTFYHVRASNLRRESLYITIYINWLYFIFMNLIPLSAITFFNLMIYRQVRIVNRMRVKLTSKEMQDIKLTTMLFCVVIVFLSCNFFAVLTNVLESFYSIHNDYLAKLSNFFVTVNSSVNFLIYVVLVRKFRLIFIRQFRTFFFCRDTKDRKNIKFMRQQTLSSSDSDPALREKL
jgi:hypothetical protein